MLFRSVSNETFLIRNNPDFVDGQMNFNYLVDPNYTQSILNRYYINDDTKINGQRVVVHPNQYKRYFANNLDAASRRIKALCGSLQRSE